MHFLIFRFFKDRHWTLREFAELSGIDQEEEGSSPFVLLEVGCGAGNLAFPLLEERSNLRVLACDFSPRAVEIVKQVRL